MASKNPIGTGIGRPRVYISYTWRTPGLERRALGLAEKLREAGIDSRIDSFYGKGMHGFTPPPPLPSRDAWDHWQEEQIRLADRILVTCTPEAVSSSSNSGFDRDLRYMEADLAAGAKDPSKFIPVGIGPYEVNRQYVPKFMQGATYYDLGSPRRGLFGLSHLISRLKAEFPDKQTANSGGEAAKKRATNAKPKKTNTSDLPLEARQLKGKIHAAIITIRVDEYEAMEATLGSVQGVEGNNSYKLAQIAPVKGDPISVVLTRVVRQGNAGAQGVASNIINELDPSWLILVGIAGGVPDLEFSLGDVGLTTYLHDFSLTAASDGRQTYEAGGGNMHRDVERFLSTRVVGEDRAKLYKLAGFDSDPTLAAHPDVYPPSIPDAERYYGTDSQKKKVEQSISRRFPKGRRKGGPVVTLGPCANGNVLLKDAALLSQWQQSARHIVQVEMELSGVYEAARTAGRENYPVLAVRGISDIVGFARHADWTGYACKTAAAFVSAILKSGLINFSKNLPKSTR